MVLKLLDGNNNHVSILNGSVVKVVFDLASYNLAIIQRTLWSLEVRPAGTREEVFSQPY